MRQAFLDDGGQFVTFHSHHGIIRGDQVEFTLLKQRQGFFAAIGSLHLVPVKSDIVSTRTDNFPAGDGRELFCFRQTTAEGKRFASDPRGNNV